MLEAVLFCPKLCQAFYDIKSSGSAGSCTMFFTTVWLCRAQSFFSNHIWIMILFVLIFLFLSFENLISTRTWEHKYLRAKWHRVGLFFCLNRDNENSLRSFWNLKARKEKLLSRTIHQHSIGTVYLIVTASCCALCYHVFFFFFAHFEAKQWNKVYGIAVDRSALEKSWYRAMRRLKEQKYTMLSFPQTFTGEKFFLCTQY